MYCECVAFFAAVLLEQHRQLALSQCFGVQDLDAVLPLALFMAHERSKGKGSFWQPYLGLLPDNPGCAWLMEPDELQQALQAAKKQVGKSLVAPLPHIELCIIQTVRHP